SAQAERLGRGAAQPVVGLDGLPRALGLPIDPRQGLGQAVGDQGSARIAGAPLDQAAVIERKAELGEIVSPRRDFTGQLLEFLDRLGHHGTLLYLCTAEANAATAQSKYRSLSYHNNTKVGLAVMRWMHAEQKMGISLLQTKGNCADCLPYRRRVGSAAPMCAT